MPRGIVGMREECYKGGVKLSIMCQPLCDCYCFAVNHNCALTADCGATEATPLQQPLQRCLSICTVARVSLLAAVTSQEVLLITPAAISTLMLA